MGWTAGIAQLFWQNWRALSSGEVGGRAVRNSAGSFAARVSATLLAFSMNVVLARIAGADGYGGFVYLMAWLNVLLIPACLGFDRLLVREVAADQSRGDLAGAKEQLRGARAVVLRFSLVLALACGTALYAARGNLSGDMLLGGYLVIALVPIVALVRVQQGALQGLHAIASSQIPEFIALPIILLLGTLVVSRILATAPPTWVIMAVDLGAGLAALALGWYLLARLLPADSAQAIHGVSARLGGASALPLMMVGAIYILTDQITPLLLGSLGGSNEVALYAAADKWSGFTVFMLQVINLGLGPLMASLYARNQMQQLQTLYTRGAQIAMLFGVPVACALMVAPRLFLGAFGAGFSGGRWALVILALGQLVNASTGSVGVLLIMTGHERSVIQSAAVGVSLCVVLDMLAIPLWGATGGAVATSASIIVTNVLLCVAVWSRLGIYPTGLGRWLGRGSAPRGEES